MSYSAEKLVVAYIAMRDDLSAEEKKFKKFEAARKEGMQKIADALEKLMSDAGGVESLKTDKGTAFRTTKDFVGVEDWNDVLAFVAKASLVDAAATIDDLVADELPTAEIVAAILDSMLSSDAFAIFNKAVNKVVTKEYMGDHEGLTPPGVSYGTKTEIQIRRPA